MKVLVVDDESPARARLCRILSGIDEVDDIEEAIDGIDALEKLNSFSPDIIFLDVQMPGMTGLDLARKLGNDGPVVIFVTAFDRYAISAFETFALDYLLKPVTPARVFKSFEKIKLNISRHKLNTSRMVSGKSLISESILTMKYNGEFRVFNTAQISAIVVKSPYIEIYYQESKFLCDGTLDGTLKELEGSSFIKIHKSHAINVSFIEKVIRLGDRKYQVQLNDYYQNVLPVGRTKIDELKGRIKFS